MYGSVVVKCKKIYILKCKNFFAQNCLINLMRKSIKKFLHFKFFTFQNRKSLLELTILFGFQTFDLAMFLAWHITSEWTHSCRFQLEYHLSMPFLNIEKVGNRKKVLITFFFCGFFQVQRKR